MASPRPAEAVRFFAALAWVDGAWASDVLLTLDNDGCWASVRPNTGAGERAGALVLAGPLLPGLVNAHSHAFQRCIAGLTERRGAGAETLTPTLSREREPDDDFWSWRERMYAAANRITPEQMEAIAGFLYAELLAGGYTHVCEFHYLHNDPHGRPYAEAAEMALALLRAAQSSGIGLTLLPTLYMRSGFGADGLREEQRRFASTPERLLRLAECVEQEAAAGGQVNVGLAIHSLRAVDPGALKELVAGAGQRPIHIHIAEQQQEVMDCFADTGQRPIEWLLEQTSPDARWNLVHATHANAQELSGMAHCGAAVVICPSTEANLGDGVFDLPGFAAAGGRWSIGSDSHVCRDWAQELQLLEYSQRLTLRQRNVAARVLGQRSSAAALFQAALAGGAQATGRALGGLAEGERADFVVLDPDAPSLLGLPADHALDALVFAGSQGALRETWVGGRRVHGRDASASMKPASSENRTERYRKAMAQLWAD
jgi:formimidoylglutamate deiminase